MDENCNQQGGTTILGHENKNTEPIIYCHRAVVKTYSISLGLLTWDIVLENELGKHPRIYDSFVISEEQTAIIVPSQDKSHIDCFLKVGFKQTEYQLFLDLSF